MMIAASGALILSMVVVVWAYGRLLIGSRSGRRLDEAVDAIAVDQTELDNASRTEEVISAGIVAGGTGVRGWVARWLYRAGFRSPNALSVFMAGNVAAIFTGGLIGLAFYLAGVVAIGEMLLRAIPGAVGEVFLPLVWLSPVAAVAVISLLPIILVRARRRSRVQSIEKDLPLTLDLLATLAEAGLSFDAGLDRVLESGKATGGRRSRPLADEMRLFRREIFNGRGRIDSLRRLKDNVDVAWFSIFISSLIHAEQIGASLAATLRSQADDLRNRRRERALAQAMAVPVKLLFPLIVCFLPGIMIASLGPIIFQITQILDQFLAGALGGA